MNEGKTIHERYGFLVGVMFNLKRQAVKDNNTEMLEQIQRAYDFTKEEGLRR